MSDAQPHVLLIDDEAPIVRVLTSSLTAVGYRVSSAAAGAEALAIIAQAAPEHARIAGFADPGPEGKNV